MPESILIPSPQILRQSTYASLIDPEQGTDLHFVITENVNGLKCAKLDQDDIQNEIEFWQNAVLCSVLGANASFEVIKGFINRI